MNEALELSRRRFMTLSAVTLAAGHLGGCDALGAGASGELAAIGRASVWLNSPRLTPEQLAGKVVLVDFWTYTCINWLRTMPYIRAWVQKYQQGLVVIGVHTPEFGFEHDLANVRRSVKDMRIEYPIVIDNEYNIWRAFANNAWPAVYLVDARGRVRQRKYGEGEYPTLERAIQKLLTEAGASGTAGDVVSANGNGLEAAADWSNLKSPEAYLGHARSENFNSPDGARRDQPRTYRAASRLALNQWTLAGDWTIGGQPVTLNSGSGQILCRFHARDVHLVMGPSSSSKPVRFRVSIDGQPPGTSRGLDVDETGSGMLIEQRLYQLVRQPTAIVDRTFAIDFLDAGAQAFSFTFG